MAKGNAQKVLEQRQMAGTIKSGGLARLEELRKQQQEGGGKKKKPQGQKSAFQRMNINKAKSVAKAQQEEALKAAQQTIGFQNPYQQINPYGQQQVSFDENGNLVVRQDFSPEQQQLFDYQQQMLQNFYGQGAEGTGMFGSADDQRARIEEELYERYTRGFDENEARQREALEQSLAERGIMPGSGENYTRAMGDFNKQWQEARAAARGQAVEAGGQEWQRSAMLPLQQAQGLFGLGGPQMGQFSQFQGTQVQPTDIGGIMGTWRGQNVQKDIAKWQNETARMGHQLNYQLGMHQANKSGGGQGFDPTQVPPFQR